MGTGGQSTQLWAKMLAFAAVADGHKVSIG
jgi:hypothetical protein